MIVINCASAHAQLRFVELNLWKSVMTMTAPLKDLTDDEKEIMEGKSR